MPLRANGRRGRRKLAARAGICPILRAFFAPGTAGGRQPPPDGEPKEVIMTGARKYRNDAAGVPVRAIRPSRIASTTRHERHRCPEP